MTDHPKPEQLTEGVAAAGRAKKTVRPVQREIDALPLASGDWSVAGVPGLYVRCGVRAKTFRLQRRVRGRIIWRVLGQVTVAEARRIAMTEWAKLRPKPAQNRVTLAEAWQRYVSEKSLAPKTRFLFEYNLNKYLADWKGRPLEEIGEDRPGVREFFLRLARTRGVAIAHQVLRQLRAVYRYHERVLPQLPPCPTHVVELPRIRPRDWALSDEELRQWWAAVQQLNPVKRMFWVTLLLTGARRGSVEALRWRDIDFGKRIVHFRVAKGGRTYSIPAPDLLLELLARYRENDAPPSEWVFPSALKPGMHLVRVRDSERGVASAHHLRHTYRTVLAELGATPDQARLLMGHSLGSDVSSGYITAPLLIEALRGLANAVARRYAEILGWSGQS
jgi:integrase